MAIVKPFRALRPFPEQAAAVSAVPYDVVNTDEARALAEGNPLSFLRVSRPEIEMPDGTDIYSDAVYEKAAANFDRLINTAPLTIEDDPSFYLYRLRMGDHEQTGVVACCSVDEYDSNIILKHEHTRRDKEDDRTRHILTLRAQTGPVFLTHRPNAIIRELMRALLTAKPLFDFTAADGVSHTIWRIPGQMNQAVIDAFAEVPKLYIADGHHRAKSASRARETMRKSNPTHNGNEEYDFFQCVIFPSDQLQILPYNRVVADLDNYAVEDFLTAVGERFEITGQADPRPAGRGNFSMYLAGKWYGLKVKGDVSTLPNVTDRLDASILQERLIGPILGIEDLRTDKRIDFIGGIRGTAELEKLVDSDRFAVAFSLHPVSLEELMDVSDAGEIMPPKSTWFEPKLRDGLLSHLI